jgi:hypothetical protein
VTTDSELALRAKCGALADGWFDGSVPVDSGRGAAAALRLTLLGLYDPRNQPPPGAVIAAGTRPTTIPWRSRWVNLRAAFMTLATGRHHYVSTACLDGVEGYCGAMTGMQGVKRPSTCKFCDAACEICAVTPSADAPPPGPSQAPTPPS